MCDIIGSQSEMDATKTVKTVVRPDLSAKLERLKRGLVADTIKLPTRKYPSLRGSQINYGLKSGRFGAFDPLRKRSKEFRKAVARFAPPFYFWQKEFISSKKLKPLVEVLKTEAPQEDTSEKVNCVWCDQPVARDDYDYHKTNRCKRRHEFLGNGYYRCSCCKEGFLVEREAKIHISLHFPNHEFINKNGSRPQMVAHKNLTIICRDQAKRKKWL